MIFGLPLRSLWRWYVIIPGFVLAVALAVGAWFAVPPTYQRNATLLLVPGAATVPDDGNPYFYLAGLTQAADVIVRAVSSENVKRDIADQHPGVSFQVTRDPTTAGPVISVVVDAPNDAAAEAVVASLLERAGNDLERLQAEDNILPSYRIQLRTVAVDDHSTLRERTRFVAAAGVGALALGAVSLLAVILAVRASRLQPVESPDSGEPGEDETSHLDEPPSWGWDSDDASADSSAAPSGVTEPELAESAVPEEPPLGVDGNETNAHEPEEAAQDCDSIGGGSQGGQHTDVRQTV